MLGHVREGRVMSSTRDRRITDLQFLPDLYDSAKHAALTIRGKLAGGCGAVFQPRCPAIVPRNASTVGRMFFTIDVHSFSGRMDAVGLVELCIGSDAVKEERIERHAEFFRQIRIDRIEARSVVGAIVRRRQHAAQQHRDLARLQPRQDVRSAQRASPWGRCRAAHRWRRVRGSRLGFPPGSTSRAGHARPRRCRRTPRH